MPRKQNENLIPRESYQDRLDELDVDEYLENSAEENIPMTELMYKSLQQKGYVRISVQKDASSFQDEIDKNKRFLAENGAKGGLGGDGKNVVTSIFDSYQATKTYNRKTGKREKTGFV